MDYLQLAKELHKQVRKHPNNALLRNDLAIALMEVNRYEHSLVHFKKAVAIDPNVQSLNNLACFYYAEGEPAGGGAWETKEKQALEILKEVVKLNPSSVFPYSLLGEIYMTHHDYDKAYDVLKTAISIQPTFENLNNIGTYYYKKSMIKKASECFYRASLKKTEDDLSLYPLLSHGICLAELGKREEALQIASDLLILNNELEDSIEDEIAYIFYITEDYSEFVNIYSKLYLLNYSIDWIPPYLYALWNIGETDKVNSTVGFIIEDKRKKIIETIVDEDDEVWGPRGKEEYIKELQLEITFLRNEAQQILAGERPQLNYEPNIESKCYLFGCKRHSNPNYLSS